MPFYSHDPQTERLPFKYTLICDTMYRGGGLEQQVYMRWVRSGFYDICTMLLEQAPRYHACIPFDLTSELHVSTVQRTYGVIRRASPCYGSYVAGKPLLPYQGVFFYRTQRYKLFLAPACQGEGVPLVEIKNIYYIY